ncbi:spore germination protein [Gottfriedia acidiceleris]|uniref:spore germination protein n=1 Tax=Gottfriedia acidiceleris TaxID=371036 RepID=UPI001431B06A|nr:spore germination protein [Gottfriedia acidiceleris]
MKTEPTIPLLKDINSNLEKLKDEFSNVFDFKTRKITFNDRPLCIAFIDTISNKEIINEKIIKVLLNIKHGNIMTDLPVSTISTTNCFNEINDSLINGKTILLEDGSKEAYIIDTVLFEVRSTSEPVNERVVAGAHDGFVESLSKNINFLRNRIRSTHFKIEVLEVGDPVTNVGILYLDNIVNKDILQNVKNRINSIELENNLTTGKLEEFIEDSSLSPFPQLLETERPDRVISNLFDGKIGVIVEGSPTVSIMPATFFMFFQTPDDYNGRVLIGTFLRIIRLFSFFLCITLPAVYISIVSFGYEILPYELVTTIQNSIEFVPFSPFVEAIIMQLILELLREAAVRLPSPIAQTIGIVGGLVIGTAIVEANLVSNTMTVVLAITAVASFVVPVHEMSFSLRLLSFPMIILASLYGFVGIIFGLTLIFIHMVKLESFGSPYFSPLAPIRIKDLKDAIIRIPNWKMKTRPTNALPIDTIQSKNMKGWKK